MKDETDQGERQVTARVKDSRQQRLKLALRENLKRRKSQARERSQTADSPSNGQEACPHGQVGKPQD